ncbi:TerB N-terminal domain-containing protein [Pelosinus sp. sgz500959]|uniref:tellurite resistance TerB family protein n=1 Tax=Pelosinus sp. sgz500959 TaxID=3242472 RepID=UPI003672AE8B
MLQLLGALVLLGVIIKLGSFFLWLGLFGIVIWVLVKIFSSKDKASETTDSPNHNTVNSHQYPSQRNYSRGEGTRTDSDSFWIGQGSTINVCENMISGGMVYVGNGLRAPAGYNVDCALIDPQLPIKKYNCDYRIRKTDYWPSYSEISPEARGAYLKWLSSGKNDPEADIGYVFLYFYGLERRLLHDIDHSPAAKNEIHAIQAEIERLLSIYGGKGSFNTYANSLLTYVKADDYVKSTVYKQAAPAATYHSGYPLELRVGLGQIARDGVIIPPDWALAWYLSTPNPPMFTRTAAQRCKDEFQMMFAEEYERAFNGGLKLTSNKTKLALSHQPASKSLLSSKAYTKSLDLPDVTVLTSYIKKFAPLVQTCHDRLDSYSRFLGRSPEKVGTLDALLELPASLWPNTVKQAINQVKLDIAKNPRPIEMKLSSFLAQFPEWKDRSKKRMGLFLDALSHHYNLGIEPDCRFGGALPEADSKVVIFDIGKDSQNAVLDPHYAVASLAMHLSVLVSQVDGKVSEEEITMLVNQADKWMYLKPAEQQRLKAHILWLSTQNLNMSGMKKRIESLDAAQKEMIGNLIIQVSQVDGSVPFEEMKLIERIYKLLGIDSTNLYSKMHQAAIEPITVVSPSSNGGGFALPTPSATSQTSIAGTIKLDMSKVAALQADSEKVTSILSTIFSEEGACQDALLPEQLLNDESQQMGSTIECLWGLSPALSELVQTLLGKQTWNKAELDEIANDRGLMLEGVLEQINEAAFDKFDQPFAEGNDIIEINQEIVKVMKE